MSLLDLQALEADDAHAAHDGRNPAPSELSVTLCADDDRRDQRPHLQLTGPDRPGPDLARRR